MNLQFQDYSQMSEIQNYKSGDYLNAAQTIMTQIAEDSKTSLSVLHELQAEEAKLRAEGERLRLLVKANKEAQAKMTVSITSHMNASGEKRLKRSTVLEQYKNEYARLYREEMLREANERATLEINKSFQSLTM